MGGGEIARFFASSQSEDCACNIDPPASSYAIMRRAGPYRGENTGPARMIAESLTPKPGIREHNRHFRDIARSQIDFRFRGKSGRAAETFTGHDRVCEGCRPLTEGLARAWAAGVGKPPREETSALVPIRLFQNPIPHLLYGDFCTIGTERTYRGKLAHVRFSNRPLRVKRFQTIHGYSVDVAHGLVLLFGNRHQGPSIMGFEDEVEQSLGRRCR